MNRRSSNMSKNDGNTNIGDPAVMEQLVQALLGQAQAPGKGQIQVPSTGTTPHQAFNRLRPLSRSMRGPSLRRRSSAFNQGFIVLFVHVLLDWCYRFAGNLSTIMERTSRKPDRPMSMSSRALNTPAVRNILQTIGTNAPRRLETFEEESPPPSRFGRRGSESTALMR